MYNNKPQDRSRGRKRFNKGARYGSRPSDGRSNYKPMHLATCEKCHEQCEVPFKPNGRKPVYCSNCFVKDSNRPSSGFAGRDRRSDRPSFNRAPDVSEQLKEISQKLDKIVRLMEM